MNVFECMWFRENNIKKRKKSFTYNIISVYKSYLLLVVCVSYFRFAKCSVHQLMPLLRFPFASSRKYFVHGKVSKSSDEFNQGSNEASGT